MTELYEENLHTLIDVMEHLQKVSSIDGVFDVEIRVRIDDVSVWAVVGWGESGDPCVLRFEPERSTPPPPPSVTTWTTTINPSSTSGGSLRLME